jgi:hypothetical protein
MMSPSVAHLLQASVSLAGRVCDVSCLVLLPAVDDPVRQNPAVPAPPGASLQGGTLLSFKLSDDAGMLLLTCPSPTTQHTGELYNGAVSLHLTPVSLFLMMQCCVFYFCM